MITPFSFFSGLICYNIFALIIVKLRNSKSFLNLFGPSSLFFIIILALLRMFMPIEFAFAKVIRISQIFPDIQMFLTQPRFFFSNIDVHVSYFSLFTIIWVIGGVFSLIKVITNEYTFRKRALIFPVQKSVIETISNVQLLMNTKYSVNIRYIKELPSPSIYGYFNPTLCLPLDNEYSQKQLFHIIHHELTHFQQKDTFIKLSLNLSSSILWWNIPFTKWILHFSECIDDIQEMKCDFVVLSRLNDSEKKVQYLNTILELLKNNRTKNDSDVKKVKNQLDTEIVKERFKIIQSNIKSSKKNLFLSKIAVYLFVVTMFFSSYLFVIQPYHIPSDNVAMLSDAKFIENEDGSYSMIVNGVPTAILTEEQMLSLLEVQDNYNIENQNIEEK